MTNVIILSDALGKSKHFFSEKKKFYWFARKINRFALVFCCISRYNTKEAAPRDRAVKFVREGTGESMSITMTDILQLAARVIVLCLAFPIHESAHAFVAYKLGDPTAKNLGRLDMNPFSHMNVVPAVGMILLATVCDLLTKNYNIGNFLLLLTSIFFFRAVPINPMYFKNRKGGMALTALAGPVSNLLLGMVFLIVYKILKHFVYPYMPLNSFAALFVFSVASLCSLVIQINLQLAVFNLLPIPPMDGFKVLSFFLSDRIIYKFEQYANYIMIAVAVLLYATPVFDYILMWGYRILYEMINILTIFLDLIAGVV